MADLKPGLPGRHSTLRTLWPYIRQMRAHLGWSLLGLLLGLLTLLASIGLLTLSGWFISATALAGLSAITAQGFNYFTPGAGVRGFAILRTVGRYCERVSTHEATFRLITRLRSWLYRQIEPLGPARLQRYGSVQLLSRLTGDIQALDNLYLRVLAPSLIAVLIVLLVGLFLFSFDAGLAVIAVAGLLVGGFVLPALGYRLGARSGEEQVHAQAALRDTLISCVQGMADLRIYGGMARLQARADEADQQLLNTQQQMARISALTGALMTLVAGTTLVAVLMHAVARTGDGLLQPVQLALVLFCVLAAFEAVAPLPLAWQYLGRTRAAAERLNELMGAAPAIQYGHEAQVPPEPGRIRFDQVSLHYAPGRVAVDRLSLDILPGEKLLLAGHSGSGKSSLLNLLARFWEPQTGQIELGGRAITDYTESGLRCQISALSQPVQLFAGTVRDNLRIGDDSVSDERMVELLGRVGLWSALGEAGLDYSIGEAGSRLSGGQRRRLGLVRALLREAPILLLDEPTEGLDAQSADAVLELVLTQRPEQTLILISHHLQAVTRFDRVVLLDQGRVLELGAPEQLLAQPDSRIHQLLELR